MIASWIRWSVREGCCRFTLIVLMVTTSTVYWADPIAAQRRSLDQTATQRPADAVTKGIAQFITVSGKHISLKSDVGSRADMQDLVVSFDAAVPQWEGFFGLEPGSLDDWKIDAFVMRRKQTFRDSGDLPAWIDFPFGYAVDESVWIMHQPSDYYTRHLLLHEGVHALTIHLYDGVGPAWFAEGLAEMLGVHRGRGNEVQIKSVPRSSRESPYWGRFKLLGQRRQEGRIPTIKTILELPNDLKGDVESYGWSWMLLMLLTEYDDFRPLVLDAAKNASEVDGFINDFFLRGVGRRLPILQARWRLLTATADYGFDWSREKVDLSMKDKLWDGRDVQLDIAADRGWQSSGVRFSPGMRIKLSATGRCSVNQEPRPWISEPPGVTIEYANDRPLGQLVYCVLPNKTDEAKHLRPLDIHSVDEQEEFIAEEYCWLLFRVNDHLGELGDNQGSYSVTITR